MQCQEGYRWHRERGKRDQIKKARKHSFKFGECQALGVWLCVCVRACTCTCEELLYDVRSKKCDLHSVLFL